MNKILMIKIHHNLSFWQPEVSHVDPGSVSSVLAEIDSKYGNIAKMTITWGKIHKYLGMTID